MLKLLMRCNDDVLEDNIFGPVKLLQIQRDQISSDDSLDASLGNKWLPIKPVTHKIGNDLTPSARICMKAATVKRGN